MAATPEIPAIVFHGTAWRFWDTIQVDGLLAQEGRQGPYVSDTHRRARHYATGTCAFEFVTTDGGVLIPGNQYAVVLRIDTSDLDLVADPCSAEPAWIAPRGIPFGAIVGHTRINCTKVLRKRREARRLTGLVTMHRELERIRNDPNVTADDIRRERAAAAVQTVRIR